MSDFVYDDPEKNAWDHAYELEIARKEARTDSLTGVLNRRGFEEEFEKMFALAVREKIDFTILMVDADGFKNINDTYGHTKGDQVLKAIANTLKDRLRKTDLLARWGGDEFIVMLVDYHGDEEKLNDDINSKIRLKIQDVPSDEIGVTIGMKIWNHEMSMEKMLEMADKRMFDKKKPRRSGNYVAE